LKNQKGNIAEILKVTVTPRFNDTPGEYDLVSIVIISRNSKFFHNHAYNPSVELTGLRPKELRRSTVTFSSRGYR
jgi:hypothetical protein